MLEKRTVLDRIEIDSMGHVFMRFLKQVVDGGVVIASEPHRSVIAPGDDPQQQAALVSQHIQMLGYPAPAAEDVARVTAHTGLETVKREKTLADERARMATVEAARSQKD